MRDPFTPAPLHPAPDPEEWRLYERKNAAAKAQYAVMPIAAGRVDLLESRRCVHCEQATRARDGQCRRCKKAVVQR